MNDLIKAVKLIKYGFRFNLNIVILLLFLVLGFVVEIGSEGSSYIGGFYIVLCGMYMFQFVMSLNMSDMIASSGFSRKTQLKIPCVLNGFATLVLYTALVIIKSINIARNPESETIMVVSLLMVIILEFTICIYAAVVYKYFVVTVIIYTIMIVIIMTFANLINAIADIQLSFSLTALIGYVVIGIGIILQYVISLLIIKKPISQTAFRGIFKDAK